MTTLLIVLLFVSFSNAQIPVSTTNDSGTTAPMIKISANKDTLWLVDDATGHLIGDTWDRAKPPKPVIIYVPISQVEAMRATNSPALTPKKKKKKRVG